MNLLLVLDNRACAYFCQWILEDRNQGKKFLIISHRLDPLISVVDYWIEMTSEGLRHVKDVTIKQTLSHLGVSILKGRESSMVKVATSDTDNRVSSF